MNSPTYIKPMPMGGVPAKSQRSENSVAGRKRIAPRLPPRPRAFWRNEAKEHNRINGLVLRYLTFRRIPAKTPRVVRRVGGRDGTGAGNRVGAMRCHPAAVVAIGPAADRSLLTCAWPR